MHINYTTYDVRRAQDVVNPSTSHCNIFVLDTHDDGALRHPFKYARILGIYHVNAVYVGPGIHDRQPQQMKFLWVRWYQTVETVSTGWEAQKLHRLRFPPMADDAAFGFVDPSDVMRSSHIIPSFAKGRLHSDNKGLSRCARDSLDWVTYYVNQ